MLTGGVTPTSTSCCFNLPMTTPMRTTPSVSISNVQLRNQADEASAGSISAIFGGQNNAIIGFAIASSGLNGNAYSVRATSSSGKIEFDSEL